MNINTIGIIGNNGTDYNFAQSLIKNGYHLYFYLFDEDEKLEKIADKVIIGSLNNQNQLEAFASQCDALFFNTRIINSDILNSLKLKTYVPQETKLIDLADDRLLLNVFLDKINVNLYPYATVVYLEDIYDEISKIGYPAILKTNHPNDDISDFEIRDEADIPHASKLLEKDVCVLEPFFENAKYYEQTMVKSNDGSINLLPINQLSYTKHKINSIDSINLLDLDFINEIKRTTLKIGNEIQSTGLLSVVYFITNEGFIYINQLKYNFDLSTILYLDSLNLDIFNQVMRAMQDFALIQNDHLTEVKLIPFGEKMPADFVRKNPNIDFHFEYHDRFNQGYYLKKHEK